MKITDRASIGTDATTGLGASRSGRAGARGAGSADGPARPQDGGGAYSVNVSAHAAVLARGPSAGAPVAQLRDSYASESWAVDAERVARGLMEEA